MSDIFWCKHCLNMSTRPRTTFDNRGWCNACQWMEEKKHMDWTPRREELKEILGRYRGTNRTFDCVVPVSGGKDGSYVAYQLKHKYGMNPLTVTVRPALSLEIGDKNLLNFINSGYNHIHVSPDINIMRALNKYGFIEKGFPYFGWLTAVMTSVIRVALNFSIPLIFYSEDGEIEYGGSTENKNKSLFSIEYMKRIYLEGGYDKVIKDRFTEQQLYFWLYPSDEELKDKQLYLTHWSYFENWDPYRNYLVAKECCGLIEKEVSSADTFTNFAQNDQALYSLHTYMMYLKFGFGRTTQDVGIEIRRGAMTREQAINLVRIYDNHYPAEFLGTYLDYYGMSREEFDAVLDKWVNRYLFEKIDGIWQPQFEIN